MSRQVTERDFRAPQFRDADPADYEFRSDGEIVRKDRWICGIGSIRFLVGINGREFEIDEVVEAVRRMARYIEQDDVLQAAGDDIWREITGVEP